jgi:hypothetical protein
MMGCQFAASGGKKNSGIDPMKAEQRLELPRHSRPA